MELLVFFFSPVLKSFAFSYLYSWLDGCFDCHILYFIYDQI